MTQDPEIFSSRYAVITGASSGIGAEFARQLASQGWNLLLTARRADLLDQLKQELLESPGIEVEILIADLVAEEGLARLEERILNQEASGNPLELLINNAGFNVYGSFLDTNLQKHLNMLHLHVIATTRLTHAAASIMRRRNRGAIINVSSLTADIPLAGSTTYSGTKSYLNKFTQALAYELEYRQSQVRLQVLMPGFTYTGFHDTEEYRGVNTRGSIPAFMWMKSEDVVRISLRDLEKGKLFCIPGWRNRLLAFLGRMGVAGALNRWMVKHGRRRQA
jgi:hypothetical protein